MLSVNLMLRTASLFTRVETILYSSQIHARLLAAPPPHQHLALSVPYTVRLSSEYVFQLILICVHVR